MSLIMLPTNRKRMIMKVCTSGTQHGVPKAAITTWITCISGVHMQQDLFKIMRQVTPSIQMLVGNMG